MEFSIQDLLPNIIFKTSRSGGKGGQHVNKVSSKVEVNFDINGSGLFTDEEKERIKQKLGRRLNSKGNIQVISEEDRSQHINKERSLEKLFILLRSALHVQKSRKATRPTKSSIEQRLKNKQQKAQKKLRRNGRYDF